MEERSREGKMQKGGKKGEGNEKGVIEKTWRGKLEKKIEKKMVVNGSQLGMMGKRKDEKRERREREAVVKRGNQKERGLGDKGRDQRKKKKKNRGEKGMGKRVEMKEKGEKKEKLERNKGGEGRKREKLAEGSGKGKKGGREKGKERVFRIEKGEGGLNGEGGVQEEGEWKGRGFWGEVGMMILKGKKGEGRGKG